MEGSRSLNATQFFAVLSVCDLHLPFPAPRAALAGDTARVYVHIALNYSGDGGSRGGGLRGGAELKGEFRIRFESFDCALRECEAQHLSMEGPPVRPLCLFMRESHA